MKTRLSPLFLILASLALASLACQFVNRAVGLEAPEAPTQREQPPVAQPAETQVLSPTAAPAESGAQEIRQWAVAATASSAYGDPSWAAEQAIGEPNVPECGDNSSAWASADSHGLDWIELTYTTPVIPTAIHIYQSYNPSQVVQVDLIDTDGVTYTAWQGAPEKIATCPDLMTITFDEKQVILVNKVVVTVDQSLLGLGWNEIDAVELVGQPK